MGLGVCAFTCAVKCGTQSVSVLFRKTGVDDYLVNIYEIDRETLEGGNYMLMRIICTDECVCTYYVL